MLPRDSIYSEAVSQPQDIYYEGSEDEDYEDAEARRLRYEAAGQRFLAGRVPLLLSATLKGPFEEESGWVNPWRSKNRTAHSQQLPEPQAASSQYSPRRPVLSASASPAAQRQALGILKNAECALPSPESLKQASFTEARSRLQGKVAGLHSWRDGDASLSPTKDGYDSWVASSPSRKPSKRKSTKLSIGAESTSKKRRRTESLELQVQTPTSGGRRTKATNIDQQRPSSQPCLRNSSIYSHIRELTSKLPRQDLSSEDGDSFDSDDVEALTADSPTNILNPSSSLPTSFSQPSLLRALSPVSISSAQSPTKQAAPVTQSPNRPRSSGGLSVLSEARTSPSSPSELEILGAGGDDGDDVDDNAIIPEFHSPEEKPSFSEPLESNDEDNSGDTMDSVPRAAPTAGPNYDEPTSASDDASTTLNDQSCFMDGQEGNYEISHGFITPFHATPPARTAHPIIYDDAEGSNDWSPDSSITALSSAQQPAASQSEAANPCKDASSNANLAKTNSPPRSSALQSLSPQNGRINSRPALQKIAQPYFSSPRKSSSAADKALYLQEEDSQQSKENVESKEAKENPLPRLENSSLPIPQPSFSEIAGDLIYKADHSQVDKAQEEPTARDTAVPSAVSFSSLLPIEATSPTDMDNTILGNALPDAPELAEPSHAQQEVSADPQPSLPMEENAAPDMFETHTTGDTLDKTNEADSIAVVADDQSQTRQQEQQNQVLTPLDASKILVMPPPQIDTQQPPSSEDLPPPAKPLSERPSTPEPQFAFTSFSSFISPSPSHRRQSHYSSDKIYSGIAPTSHGILVTSKNRAWRNTASKKRVSWAPLPNEETGSSGDKISSETDTSSSLSRGRDRAVSPPPPPSSGLASDSLTERDMKFSHHFAAVADRSKGTQLQSVPTASGHASYSPGWQAPVTAVQIASSTEITSSLRVNPQKGEKGSAKSASGGWDDDSNPTDIVEDIFNEMDDFLQVWDVDAELDEARKADKVRATASKKQAETLSEGDMNMDMDMDIALQFF
ncbi:hypothetical protein V8C42DRAFT_328358 [Trichoderma barbatum]